MTLEDILKNDEAYEIAANEILRKHIQVKQNFDMTTSIEIPNKEITVGEGIILADWLCPSKNKPARSTLRYGRVDIYQGRLTRLGFNKNE